MLWESKAHADAFAKEREGWRQKRTEYGHQMLRSGGGEVVGHVTPQK